MKVDELNQKQITSDEIKGEENNNINSKDNIKILIFIFAILLVVSVTCVLTKNLF